MPLVILCIVAVVNLLLLSGLLLIKKPRTKANRVLAYIILDPAISLVFIIMIYYRTAANYPVIYYVSYLYDFLCPTLFYYYIHRMLHKKIRFTVRSPLHFLCFFIGLTFFLWLMYQPEPYRHGLLMHTQTGKYPWQFYILDYLTILQVGIYLTVCYTIIKKHNRHIEQVFSNTVTISAQWLQKFGVLAIFLCAILYFPSFINANLSLYMIMVPIASLILYFYLVYKAICSPMVFSTETLKIIDQTKEITKAVNIETNTVSSDTALALANTLEKLFLKKKLFLDTNLNIQMLAELCNTRVYILSAFINKHYNKSFYDYINYYRIEEAKKLLTDPEYNKYSIDTIANKSGYGSRSVFYAAFKKNTGTTPGEYLKTIHNNPK